MGDRLPLMTQLARWPVFGVHKLLEERSRSIGDVRPDAFEAVFERYDDATVFTHVGLSDVNRALPGNPFEQVLGVLDRNFESVLAPGFTDYFKTSRVYSKRYSRPKHGTFNALFLDVATYRTDDACRSILVRGPYRFEGRNHHDTFSPNGCFAQLREDDVLLTSIGTPWLVCSFLHYLEWKHRVPYVTERSFEGVIYDGPDAREITQTTQYQEGPWRFNKLKMQRDMREHGIVDEHDLEGLRVFFVHLSDVEAFVDEQLRDDPYYLVT